MVKEQESNRRPIAREKTRDFTKIAKKTKMNDPRLNLPSASSFELDCICPGRQTMLQTLSPQQRNPPSDADAEFGIAIHKTRETGDISNLTAEQLEVYERGMKTESLIVDQWKSDFKINSVKEGPREFRVWLNDPETLQPITSAQLDAHYIHRTEAGTTQLLIIDWKAYFCSTLTPAERNWQSRVQAVAAAEEYNSINVRCVFNKAMFGTYDAVEYCLSDLKLSRKAIQYRAWESRNKDAQRVAGLHCRRCPASRAAMCPEAGAYSLLPSVIASGAKEMVQRLRIEDCVKLWEKSSVIKDILESATDRLKSLPDEELNALGLKRGKPRNLDPITDTKGAFDVLIKNIAANNLWTTLQLSKTKLSEVIAEEMNITKKEAAKWIVENLSSFITKKQSESPLERAK